MQHGDRLAEERRARLAAELMLEQVQAELSAANQKIAATNRELSDEIVVKREEVQQVRTVAETLRDENLEVRSNLQRAESAIMIAERRLWDSLETIHDGFAVFDTDRVMVAANRAYLAAFDGLEMIGPGVHYHEMLRIMCEEGIVDLENTPAEDWQLMMAARWDAERIEPVTVKLWNGAFVKVIDRRTRDGDMVSLGLNITGTIQREAELERARARAEAANRAKSAFLANMSHEIRTPMNGVIGMADMLSETSLDEEQRLFVETIRNSGEALLVIINDVLDYSKIEAKKLELHPARFDLERCIHEVLMLLQPTAHDKGLQLAVDYDMFMPTEFVGDPGRVRQILTNLAGNAVKFTEAGHVAIRVVGLPVRDGSAYRVHVTVEDTGIGIPDEKLRTIFGEFSQVEDERNRRYDGTGLGLAITKRLVEMMEGEVWVDSEVNVGSGFGFHITMPVAEGAATPPISAPDWIERAIVVDEPQMTRAILTKQLAAMGLQAISVRAGAELDGLAPTGRDVIILGDVTMAEQLARTAGEASAPVLALLSAPLAGAALPGVTAAIQKPAQRREIARVLGSLPPPAERATTGAPEAAATADGPEARCVSLPDPRQIVTGTGGDAIALSETGVAAAGPVPSAEAPSLSPRDAAPVAQPTEPGAREMATDDQPGAPVEAERADDAGAPRELAGSRPPETEPSGGPSDLAAADPRAPADPGPNMHPQRDEVGAAGDVIPEPPGAPPGLGGKGVSRVETGTGPEGPGSDQARPGPRAGDGFPGPAALPGATAAEAVEPVAPEAARADAPDDGAEPAALAGSGAEMPLPEATGGMPATTVEATRGVPAVAYEHPAEVAPLPDPAEAELHGSPVPGPAGAETSSDSGRQDARQMRVLAAEDNKTNRLVFAKMVQSLDIELVFAENGREAVVSFENAPPDLIFTDISMPEMDGKEASRHIRRIEAAKSIPRTPIVAITAHAMAGDAEEILAAGIDTYLTKPLKRSALVEAIRAAAPAGVRDPLGPAARPDGASADPGPALQPAPSPCETGPQPPDAILPRTAAE